jgi:hypothetical protein
MPQLLKREVVAERVLQQIFMESVSQPSEKEVETEKFSSCA